MSRTDQYIGLTRDAESFVSDKERTGSSSLEGAFGNQFSLGIWRDDTATYRETVQVAPWKSGPMYYTYLLMISLEDPNNSQELFRWVYNPTVDDVDYKRGHCWF